MSVMDAPPMTPEEASAYSAELRADRARIREGVLQGLSLALLLNDRTEALQGVTVYKLVRMLPHIGAARARTLMMGLPHYEAYRDLDASQRRLLITRIGEYERHALKLSGVTGNHWRA